MKMIKVGSLLCLLVCALAACRGTYAGGMAPTPVKGPDKIQPSSQVTPTPDVTLTMPAVTPIPSLGDYYLYQSPTLVIFLDFPDTSDYRVDTTTYSNDGQPCLKVLSENDMSYHQQGPTLTIQALYIYQAPFTLNADNSLTTHEPVTGTGQIITETFYPSSIDAYNKIVARMEAKLQPC